ncbi:hypothetical protein PMV52_10150 [Eggerthella lenta]|uniref:hypothetical protein n=1 Tax=Eggerthella lenta TaxID=84112 RepID=UPI00233113B7|nr:hypothetical protein [Eggerthella lenta]MDB1793819.1 hypothetical protein [Eggerthella lenta]MEE0592350.1 hypothetical protein [Eggerthella lenta]
MTDPRNPGPRPTVDEYRTMMRGTHVPDQLKQATLSEAGRRRGRSAKTVRTPVRTGASVRRRSALGFAVAACLVLVAGIGATAFAINGPGGFGPGKTVELESQDFTGGGGYSGPWYNPADDTFWSYEWAGYKYHFPVRCVGNNIESVTYEIEGERSYFEIIDNTVTAEQHDNGKHVFNYTKSVTFDYDHQESIDDQRIVEIYIGFPLPEEGKEAYELALAGKNSLEASRQLNTAIEKGAAREISTSRLKLTATFADGSMQTKTYRIAPVPDFDERYEAYSDARAAFQSIEPPSSDASQQEIDDYLGKMPQMPKLYTIEEVDEE